MHRLPVESSILDFDSPVLSKEAAKHLKVLRPEAGEVVELFDGKGLSRRYVIELDGREFLLRPDAEHPSKEAFARPTEMVLFACVTKGSRWDWTIEKATELGVTKIVPVISDRTIVRIPASERAAKRERWLRIAEDAARQSDAKWIPEVLEPVDFRDSLMMVEQTTCYIGALTNPPPPMLSKAVMENSGSADRPVAVYVGPEGDFTPEELSALMKVARPTSFGETILRAETAAIYAVSVVKALIS